ncbi:MAG: penicillin-binding protein 2 [Nocardioidaceae bacterium]
MTTLTRGRFVVIQVLVLALFCSLLGRLWYLQVVGGDSYRAQAQSNAVRDVIVQPQRGLIVDSTGRSLVANRLAWVVTVDRSRLAVLPTAEQSATLRQLGRTLGLPYGQVLAQTKLCGEKGAPDAGLCWNGSPYEAVPVAADVDEDVALAIAERPEDFPAVEVQQQNVRSYPTPYGANAAHLLGYVTSVTEDEYAAAKQDDDTTLNAASQVGRSGLERSYDRFLRGLPGSTGKSVDSSGRVIGSAGATPARPGDTLVTSIDAKVQAKAEDELRAAIMTARQTHDDVTGEDYKATSGAMVVMEAKTGRLVASASYPTYDPEVWVGGISSRQLKSLYSKDAGEPLLSRATQGQLAPGSTFKPVTAAGALDSGYPTSTELDCSSSFQVGNRTFKNYESASYGPIDFASALQLSCDTFFYRIAYAEWLRQGGDDPDRKDVLVENAKKFGFGRQTGIDLPGEASGRIADRAWRRQYWKDNKDYYCKIGRSSSANDYLHLFAREFCVDGYLYRAGDAVNFAIGQGDTLVTPMQLAVVYAAMSNGGALFEPRVAKAVVDPYGDVAKRISPHRAGSLPISDRHRDYIDDALLGTAKTGTMAWKMQGFPLEEVQVRAKTGTAEVQGKQTTGWVATYDENYVVIMMMEQGGTGSGSSGDAVRHMWEALYGIDGDRVEPAASLLPAGQTPSSLPVFGRDGTVEAPR